jgi:NADP-dependent 3-hydroxy acid dehydrogenase YdfG
MSRSLAARTAVVTGASSGIGEAVARRLVAEGVRVAGFARRVDRLQAIADGLGDAFLPVACDVRDADSIRDAFASTRRAFGGVDTLVANAGIGADTGLLDGLPEAWRSTLDVNVWGAMACAREALSDLGDAGHIVFVGSMSGHRVPTGAGMYAASKFALRATAQGLRQELRAAGRHVRVAHVSPGVVETRFGLSDADPSREALVGFTPLTADDIADIVAYVLAAPPHVDITDVLVRPTEQKT